MLRQRSSQPARADADGERCRSLDRRHSPVGAQASSTPSDLLCPAGRAFDSPGPATRPFPDWSGCAMDDHGDQRPRPGTLGQLTANAVHAKADRPRLVEPRRSRVTGDHQFHQSMPTRKEDASPANRRTDLDRPKRLAPMEVKVQPRDQRRDDLLPPTSTRMLGLRFRARSCWPSFPACRPVF